MKKLLSCLAAVCVLTAPSVSLISCGSGDSDNTITIQDTEGASNHQNAMLTDVIQKVENQVNSDSKFSNLKNFKFRLIKTDTANNFTIKLKAGTPYTDPGIPDVFTGNLDDQFLINSGFYLPIDHDTDSLGWDGTKFNDSIGLVADPSQSTAKDASGNAYSFDSQAYNFSQAYLSNQTKKSTVFIPVTYSNPAGFFFNKSPEQLKIYKDLRLGEIVYTANAKDDKTLNEPNAIAGNIIDYTKDGDKIDAAHVNDFTFSFGQNVKHFTSDPTKEEGYVSFNQLTVANELLNSWAMAKKTPANLPKELDGWDISQDASINSAWFKDVQINKKQNILALGNFYWIRAQYIYQIASKSHPDIKDGLIGDSWDKTNYQNNHKYFDNLQAQLTENKEISSSDFSTTDGLYKLLSGNETQPSSKSFGTVLSNSDFSSSAKNLFQQLFTYDFSEMQLARSTSWGTKGNDWQSYFTANATGSSNDPLADDVQNKLLRGGPDSENTSDLFFLNNNAPQWAATRMFDKNDTPTDPSKISADKLNDWYQNLDVASTYNFGFSNDKLGAPSADGVNTLVHDTASQFDGSARNGAGFDSIKGTTMAYITNARIVKQSTYKQKLSLIRMFYKTLIDNYMANKVADITKGAAEWYNDNQWVSPIAGVAKYIEDNAATIYKSDYDKQYQNTVRTHLFTLLSIDKWEAFQKAHDMQGSSFVQNTSIKLDDDNRHQYSVALNDLLSQGKTLDPTAPAGNSIWEDYAKSYTDVSSIGGSNLDGYYSKLNAVIDEFFKTIIAKFN